jgi:hypothetical protein
MGYPMTWRRLVGRNGLNGDYNCVVGSVTPLGICQHPMIAGDMRRLERDARDAEHLREHARNAGVTPEQAKAVLDAFFQGFPEGTRTVP